jgi:hypothetical protein
MGGGKTKEKCWKVKNTVGAERLVQLRVAKI